MKEMSTWKSWNFIPLSIAHFAGWGIGAGLVAYAMATVFRSLYAALLLMFIACGIGSLLTTAAELLEYDRLKQDFGKTIIDLYIKHCGLFVGAATMIYWRF